MQKLIIMVIVLLSPNRVKTHVPFVITLSFGEKKLIYLSEVTVNAPSDLSTEGVTVWLICPCW